jgi:hypothetical protein
LPLFRTVSRSARASFRVSVIGLSHTTWKPAFRKVVATGACKKFGVTIDTKSIRSPAGRAASALAIASKDG